MRVGPWRTCCAPCALHRTSSSVMGLSGKLAPGHCRSSTLPWRASPTPPKRRGSTRAWRTPWRRPCCWILHRSASKTWMAERGANARRLRCQCASARSCARGARLAGDTGENNMHEHDVVGIGNAIVDIIGRCDDAFLARHGYPKGSMQLVDAAGAAKLYDAMGPAVEISGGSGANTI